MRDRRNARVVTLAIAMLMGGGCLDSDGRANAWSGHFTEIVTTNGARFSAFTPTRMSYTALTPLTEREFVCDDGEPVTWALLGDRFLHVCAFCPNATLEEIAEGGCRLVACEFDEDCPMAEDAVLHSNRIGQSTVSPLTYECVQGVCQTTDETTYPRHAVCSIDVASICMQRLPFGTPVTHGQASAFITIASIPRPSAEAPCGTYLSYVETDLTTIDRACTLQP